MIFRSYMRSNLRYEKESLDTTFVSLDEIKNISTIDLDHKNNARLRSKYLIY